ncbi:pheromone A receptor-domain-containing protein [Fomitopsis serialis]|uniref:pheromone A receptor-domain-containing protein n=1 Tax=Fomitopsis serialis TaxID=139415 RepID=UPI00200803FE|nr:pheromone A receptor-domain-containing protein [Neoantrodia serialis]KAH9919592.1 pheromone A receptor-domain-containing protein [Neoantrodia serialis]
MHPELPYLAFIAASLVLVPLPWHWRARNVATLSIIAWLFVVNTIYGVDAVIWADNVDIVIPVWCDITTKILIGANMALPAACMCICIHLEQVASLRDARISTATKQRRQVFEGLICFGLPAVWMALHYVVQGHRFDIIEGYGCRPSTYVSVPSMLLLWVPPLILSAISFVFAALALHHFIQRRLTFAKHLANSRSGLTTSRLRPWTSFADVHWGFSAIDQYAMFGTPQLALTYYYVIWLIVPVSSFVFFAFFAFGRDAVMEYGACVAWVRRVMLRQRQTDRKAPSDFVSLPSARMPTSPFSKFSSSSKSTFPTSEPTTPISAEKNASFFENRNPPTLPPLCHSLGNSFTCPDRPYSYTSFVRSSSRPSPPSVQFSGRGSVRHAL